MNYGAKKVQDIVWPARLLVTLTETILRKNYDENFGYLLSENDFFTIII